MNIWVDSGMDEWMDGWMDGQINRWRIVRWVGDAKIYKWTNDIRLDGGWGMGERAGREVSSGING